MRGFDEENPAEMGLGDPSVGGVPICGGLWGTFWGSVWRNSLKWGWGTPVGGGLGGVPICGGRFWGSVWRTPAKWAERPQCWGFWGGVPISGGLWRSILGFCVENPPQMGLGDPNAEGLGGSPFVGVFGG